MDDHDVMEKLGSLETKLNKGGVEAFEGGDEWYDIVTNDEVLAVNLAVVQLYRNWYHSFYA